ncbi:galactokinase [Sulfobacillus harzensis]|uniref:Galactokinase n=1 Tax=Sulfobacillus harzensis TaxID=2729629 RepID=A0A7Y0L3Z2_9FIRM|nr:galactokinase [Sulfobacillus harzensis]NMP22866.1 galactokinase [Sulfobacillus harzensis]
MVTAVQSRIGEITDWFGGSLEGVRWFFAPGRVNLIGEHLDYNGGRVLPAALELGVWLLARPRADAAFRFASSAFPEEIEVKDGDLGYRPEHGFANYPKGVLWVLREQGWQIPGMDFLFFSNLPSGAGLSSSAAVEVVTGFALAAILRRPLTPQGLARMAQRAENDYVGVQCGIMDQFAVTAGRENAAVLLDCERLTFEYVPLDLGAYRLIIINSNKERKLAESRYNLRREECQEALAILRQRDKSVLSLATLSPDLWEAYRPLIDRAVLRRRVDHVVSENARVKEAVRLLRMGDLPGFALLLNLSHESLRDFYEVTGPELDALVEAAQQAPGCLGARMTGAGFGGCALALVKADQASAFEEAVQERYRTAVGREASFYVSAAGNGVREVTEEVQS